MNYFEEFNLMQQISICAFYESLNSEIYLSNATSDRYSAPGVRRDACNSLFSILFVPASFQNYIIAFSTTWKAVQIDTLILDLGPIE